MGPLAECQSQHGSPHNYGLKLTSRLAAPRQGYYTTNVPERRGQSAGSQLNPDPLGRATVALVRRSPRREPCASRHTLSSDTRCAHCRGEGRMKSLRVVALLMVASCRLGVQDPSDPYGMYQLVACGSQRVPCKLVARGIPPSAVPDTTRIYDGRVAINADGTWSLAYRYASFVNLAWGTDSTLNWSGTYVVDSGAGSHVILRLTYVGQDYPLEPVAVEGRSITINGLTYLRP